MFLHCYGEIRTGVVTFLVGTVAHEELTVLLDKWVIYIGNKELVCGNSSESLILLLALHILFCACVH
jgi:hypothetical protein